MAQRKTAGRAALRPLPVSLMALQVAALLSGCIGGPPHGAGPAASQQDAAPWAGLPSGLAEQAGLPALAKLLGGPGAGMDAAPSPPSDLGDLLGRFLPDGLDRLPIPAAPAGGEPLLSALSTYAAAQGLPPVDAAALRPAIAGLQLTPRAEAALSQLVLAYVEAVRLQAESVRGLGEDDLRFLADPAAAQRWLAEDPSRTPADAEARAQSLLSSIDRMRVLQGADLLARTIEAARVPLSDPPAPSPAQPTTDTQGAGMVGRADVAPTASMPARGGDADAWGLVEQLLPHLAGQPRTPLPGPAPDLTLGAALRDLASSYGVPADTPLGTPALPPSLDHAVARIVAAKALGVHSGDPGLAGLALVEATRAAQPTLEAWAALLRMPAFAPVDAHGLVGPLVTESASASPSAAAMLARSMGRNSAPAPPTPPTLRDALVRQGMPASDALLVQQSLPVPVGLAVAQILGAMQATEAAREALLAPLTPAQRLAVEATPHIALLLAAPSWSPEEAALVRQWAEANSLLDPVARAALEQARLEAVVAVEAAVASLRPYTDLRQRQDSPTPALPAGLGGPLAPVKGIADGTLGACRDIPTLPNSPPLSDCAHDVWLDYAPQQSNGHGIVVTGFGSTPGGSYGAGAPALLIDLGGSDVYDVPAGTASYIPSLSSFSSLLTFPDCGNIATPAYYLCTAAFVLGLGARGSAVTGPVVDNVLQGNVVNVAVDMGGNDDYGRAEGASSALAQGAALGIGTLGILVDAGGNDRYTHQGDAAQAYNLAQGAGGLGGTGILLDLGGSDVYSALGPGSLAQGVGTQPPSDSTNIASISPFPSTGLLLDLGDGGDAFRAQNGQGLSFSQASVGLLLDQAGPTDYQALSRPGNQGGRAGPDYILADVLALQTGTPFDFGGYGGMGALIDLGGPGDRYSTAGAGDQNLYFTHDEPGRKGDDALWLDVARDPDVTTGHGFVSPDARTLGFGLDTTLDDEDGDLCRNVVELFTDTDPQRNDCSQADASALLDLLGDPLGGLKNSDGDLLFPDAIERLAGSDPDDPESTPATALVEKVRSTGLRPLLLCDMDTDAASPCPADNPPQCDPDLYSCVSLLTLGGAGDDVHDVPALVFIDLGGDDRYPAGAAGTYHTINAGGAYEGYSLDLGGNDTYGRPGLDDSLASDMVGGGVALLLDLAGNDTYLSRDNSQGASTRLGGHGILVDFLGDDRYEARSTSQGSVASANVPIVGQRSPVPLQVSALVATVPGTPAVNVADSSRGALLDLAGNDTYIAQRQAFVADAQAAVQSGVQPVHALLFDQAGADTYRSVTPPVEADGLTRAAPGAAFDSQGFGPGAAFIDGSDAANGTRDTYLGWDVDGNWTDLSAIKNDALRGRAQDGMLSFQGGGLFADNLTGLPQDADGDGAVGLAELLAGTDPGDPASHPGNASRPDDDLDDWDGGGALAQADQPGTVLPALAGVELPGLLIAPRTDSWHRTAFPFLVDLGGSDHYLAPNLGSSSLLPNPSSPLSSGNPSSLLPRSPRVALVLDLNATASGDVDEYAPQPCVRDTAAPPWGPNVLTGLDMDCPSLGGANGGIAIVADMGGRDSTFRSAMALTARVQNSPDFTQFNPGQMTARALTQGAAANNGVGILATRSLHNEFEVRVEASVRKSGLGTYIPQVAAQGLAQGASSSTPRLAQGIVTGNGIVNAAAKGAANGAASTAANATIGLLASFDPLSNDTYMVVTDATVHIEGGEEFPGITQGFSQGYAAGGALFDAGGTNRFNASGGRSQGAGGLLWSGSGDDQYVLGQTWAAAAGADPGRAFPSSLFGQGDGGALVDGGGSDVYRLLPAAAGTPGNTAGAGQGHGQRGLLLDLSGDDRYDASGWTYAQAARGGTLVDLGGHDTYRAASRAQSFSDVANAPSTLVDMGGDDAYLLLAAEGWGQGRGQSSLFLDAAGSDTYVYPTTVPHNPAYLTVAVSQPTASPPSASASPGSPAVSDGPTASPGSPTVTNGPTASPGSPTVTNGPTVDTQTSPPAVSPGSPAVSDGPTASPGSPAVTNGPTASPGAPTVTNGPTATASPPTVTPPTATPAPRAPERCNGCYWQVQTALGIDADSVDRAFRAYKELEVIYNGNRTKVGDGTEEGAVLPFLQFPGTVAPPVVARNRDGTGRINTAGPGESPQEQGDRLLYLFACVAVQEGVERDRVEFLLEGAVLGKGEEATDLTPAQFNQVCPGALPRSQVYRYRWDTRPATDTAFAQAFPDGEYDLKASAFFTPNRTLPHPDVQAIDSPRVTLALNNPPLIAVSPVGAQDISTNASAPAGERRANLTVTVSRNHAIGSPADAGTFVSINGRRAAGGTIFNSSGNASASAPFSVNVTGLTECQPAGMSPCPDGLYTLTVTANDNRNANGRGNLWPVVQQARTLLIDGSPPTSYPDMGPVANTALLDSNGNLLVTVRHDDGTGNVSGVASVVLLSLDAQGAIRGSARISNPGNSLTSVIPMPGIQSGSTARFATVAVDNLGNPESPCEPGEPPIKGLCTRAKLNRPGAIQAVQTDFIKPVIDPVVMAPAFVRPLRTVTFTTNVTDIGFGLANDGVSLEIEAFRDGMGTLAGSDTYRNGNWGNANGDYAGEERAFQGKVVARDGAGNVKERTFSGNIDDKPPHVTVRPTAYIDVNQPSQNLAAGRLDRQNPVIAHLLANLTDLKRDGSSVPSNALMADLGGIVSGGGLVSCTKGTYNNQFSVWDCPILLDPATFSNGTFAVPLIATDIAGNVDRSARAPLVVASAPLDLFNIDVVEVRHDGFKVRWESEGPGTSQVVYGKTPNPQKPTEELHTGALRTSKHEVDVTGLPPSTLHYFKVVTRSASGTVSESPVTQTSVVRTRNAYTVGMPALGPDQALKGIVDLDFPVHLLASTDAPVHVTVQVQDADGLSSPVTVADFQQGEGTRTVAFDTRAFADGFYFLGVEADRLGDFFEDALPEPFLIDNTAPLATPVAPRPGGTIAEARPQLQLRVLDPVTGVLPSLDTLRLWVDGAEVAPANVSYGDDTDDDGQSTLSITLPGNLPDGPRTVTVELADLAGNRDRSAWSFRVDRLGPTLVGTPAVHPSPGPAAAKPGGAASLALNLTDPSAVAAASLDLTALGGAPVPLLNLGGGRWEGSFAVPRNAPNGTHLLPLEASDGLGNVRIVPIPLLVDAVVPTLSQAAASPAGFTSVRLDLAASEPVRIEVRVPGREAPVAPPAFALSHQVTVGGLRPNHTYALAVRAIDGAGLASVLNVTAAPVGDSVAPGRPGAPLATSEEEGTVRLSWGAASDNAGIGHYRIVRAGPNETVLPDVPSNRTTAVDPGAPAGEVAAYRIQAVDLAGHAGPEATTQVRVLSLPHLGNATVTPERGPSDAPFHLRVMYWSTSGRPAERVEVRYGGTTYALSPVQPNASCATPCAYAADLLLPPTSQRDRAPPVFRAAAEGRFTELAWDGVLLVRTGESSGLGAVGPGSHPAPGLGPVALLPILLALAALAAPRLRRTRP